MFSTGSVLASRREDAIRFLTAQSKALRYAMAHRDETLKLTFEESDAPLDDPRPAFVFDDAVRTRAVAPDLPIPMEKIAWMQDQLVSLGQIPKAGDINKMVDGEIRAEAMKRVGR
jgi:NitT/TauT family transport system substrate-binding protein